MSAATSLLAFPDPGVFRSHNSPGVRQDDIAEASPIAGFSLPPAPVLQSLAPVRISVPKNAESLVYTGDDLTPMLLMSGLAQTRAPLPTADPLAGSRGSWPGPGGSLRPVLIGGGSTPGVYHGWPQPEAVARGSGHGGLSPLMPPVPRGGPPPPRRVSPSSRSARLPLGDDEDDGAAAPRGGPGAGYDAVGRDDFRRRGELDRAAAAAVAHAQAALAEATAVVAAAGLDSRGEAPRSARRRAAAGQRQAFKGDEWADGAEFEDGAAGGGGAGQDGEGSVASEVEAELAAAGWKRPQGKRDAAAAGAAAAAGSGGGGSAVGVGSKRLRGAPASAAVIPFFGVKVNKDGGEGGRGQRGVQALRLAPPPPHKHV